MDADILAGILDPHGHMAPEMYLYTIGHEIQKPVTDAFAQGFAEVWDEVVDNL